VPVTDAVGAQVSLWPMGLVTVFWARICHLVVWVIFWPFSKVCHWPRRSQRPAKDVPKGNHRREWFSWFVHRFVSGVFYWLVLLVQDGLWGKPRFQLVGTMAGLNLCRDMKHLGVYGGPTYFGRSLDWSASFFRL